MKFFLIQITVFFALTAKAQTFQKIVGSVSGNETISSVQQAQGGGYLLAGNSDGGNAHLTRIDANGNIIWSKIFDGGGTEGFNNFKQCPDGGCILVGQKNPGSAMLITRTDSSGNIIWTRSFSSGAGDTGNAVALASDGGFVICGTSGSNAKLVILKMDALGNLIWKKRFEGFNSLGKGNDIISTMDGGYCMVGRDNIDGLIIKIDSMGNLQWMRQPHHMEGFAIRQTVDSGYIIGGKEWLNSTDQIYLLKIDSSGNLEWFRNYLDSGSYTVQTVQQLTNKGYLIIGSVKFPATATDICIIKTDSVGYFKWAKSYGNQSADTISGGHVGMQTNDGGFILCGRTNLTGNDDILLIKTDSMGYSGCNETLLSTNSNILGTHLHDNPPTMDIVGTSSSYIMTVTGSLTDSLICYEPHTSIPQPQINPPDFSIYPNPAFDYIIIDLCCNAPNAEVKIFNSLGALKINSSLAQPTSKIDISNLSRGIYLIEVGIAMSVRRAKFIVE